MSRFRCLLLADAPCVLHMQDAASWLFPSTEASRAASQAQSKSKQLVQRFNQAFRRNKPIESSTNVPKSSAQPELNSQLAVNRSSEAQGRAGIEAMTAPGPVSRPQSLKPEGSPNVQGSPETAQKAGQMPLSLRRDHNAFQRVSPYGSSAQLGAERGNSPAALASPPSAGWGLSRPSSALPPQDNPKMSFPQSPFPRTQLQPVCQPSSPASASRIQPQPSVPDQAEHNVVKGSSKNSPDSAFALPPSTDCSNAKQYGQGRALSRQQSAPAARALGSSPDTWSATPVLPAVPTPDREEDQQRRSGLKAFASPKTPPVLGYGDVPRQQEDDYIPGRYDGTITMTRSAPQQPAQQQQQRQAWFQSQDQQQQLQQQLPQQQLQQQLSTTNSRDYMVDMQALSTVSTGNRQTSFEPQRGQRGVSNPSSNPGQANSYPELAQQVPFYESSPEYMPTTIAAKTPISTRVTSYFTGMLRSPKQPADLEAGTGSTANSPTLGQQPGEPPIFQNPAASDQDRPMSQEQAERRARGLVRTRVEPKVFFANERTFLQWLQISVLLMFTGLSLLGGSSISSMGGSSDASSACASDNTACKASKVRL